MHLLDTSRPPGGDGFVDAVLDGLKDKFQRIRCPRCAWRPQASDRWSCLCGHVWNTFDTRGRCPGCGLQWLETQCLACHRYSAHEDWYEHEAP